MTAILGISAFYHDAAAALLVDGRLAAAAQEERFTRRKHDPAFPARAIDACLNAAGLTAAEIDYVGFYDKPLLKFDRLIETWLAFAPRGFRAFARAAPVWISGKMALDRQIRDGLGGAYRKRIVYTDHHVSHAASAFFPSPFDEAAILTMDGVGEWATASLGTGRGRRVTLTHEQHFPHSLGLLYSAFTAFCGFRVNSGEYKLMGLAPYGEPRFVDRIRRVVHAYDDGSLWMDMSYFRYCHGLTMTSAKFDALFDGPPRQPEAPITDREMDLAASIQVVTEDLVLKAARHAHRLTGLSRLCLAGGVALNCVANGRLLREGPFEDIWIQPAAGDAGGALGVAYYIWHHLLERDRQPLSGDAMQGSLLGPQFSQAEVEAALRSRGAIFTTFPSDADLDRAVVDLLAGEQVVGWFQGRMEFGPRALGARSILGDARSPALQSTMNLKIKFRESFRPFAPVVTAERAADYFEWEGGRESPYMLMTAGVSAPHRLDPGGDARGLRGLDKLRTLRSDIPAVTHVDHSARIQTADAGRFPRLRALLHAFEQRTGVPVLINTSFNVRGEPIVCSPDDAYRCFMATGLDALVIERCLLLKRDQPAGSASTAGHLAQFHPD